VEFKWANYFRERIDPELVKNDFGKALKLALKLAKDPAAADLPGYKQPSAVAATFTSKKKARALRR